MPNYQSFNYNTQSTKAHVKPTLAQKCHIAGQEPTPPLSPHPQLKKPYEIDVAPRKWQDGLDKGSCLLKVMVAGFAFPTKGASTGHLSYSKNGIK